MSREHSKYHILATRLAALEVPVVASLLIAAVAVERLLPVALVVAALFWIVRWLAHRRLSVRTPADLPILLLIVLMPVTLWATALPAVTRLQVSRLLAGVACYYAVANWAVTRARLRLTALGLTVAGLALALAAPLLGGLPAVARFVPPAIGRLAGRMSDAVNPNIVAGTLALLAPVAVAPLLFGAGRRWTRGLALGVALVMLGVIGLTSSRGAWIAVAGALLLMGALRWRYGWLAVPGAALAAGLAVWRSGGLRVLDAVTRAGALGGFDVRLEIWSRASYMIQDFPFTGIGMGTFRQVANLLYPFFLAGPDAEIPHAHNLFLQVAVDLGVPGLLAWLALFMLACVLAWQTYRGGRTSGDRWLAGLGAGLLGSQVALVIHGLTDAAMWGTRPAIVVWALWGLTMVAVCAQPKEIHAKTKLE